VDSNMGPDELVAAMRIACERAHQLDTLCRLAGLLEEGPASGHLVQAKSPGACPEISGNTHRDLHTLLQLPTAYGSPAESSDTACSTDEPYFWNQKDPLCPAF